MLTRAYAKSVNIPVDSILEILKTIEPENSYSVTSRLTEETISKLNDHFQPKQKALPQATQQEETVQPEGGKLEKSDKQEKSKIFLKSESLATALSFLSSVGDDEDAETIIQIKTLFEKGGTQAIIEAAKHEAFQMGYESKKAQMEARVAQQKKEKAAKDFLTASSKKQSISNLLTKLETDEVDNLTEVQRDDWKMYLENLQQEFQIEPIG